jgi:hypothetical protein
MKIKLLAAALVLALSQSVLADRSMCHFYTLAPANQVLEENDAEKGRVKYYFQSDGYNELDALQIDKKRLELKYTYKEQTGVLYIQTAKGNHGNCAKNLRYALNLKIHNSDGEPDISEYAFVNLYDAFRAMKIDKVLIIENPGEVLVELCSSEYCFKQKDGSKIEQKLVRVGDLSDDFWKKK